MPPARRPTGPRPAHPLPEGFEREITPIHGTPIGPLDAALVARSAADAAAMADVPAGGGIPLWAKLASVPATVILLAGLLVISQQRSDALLKESRADARQDRVEFRAAIEKLAGAVEKSTAAQEKNTAVLDELRRDLRERGGRGRDGHGR